MSDRSSWLTLAVVGLIVCAGSLARTALGPLQEAMAVAWELTDNQISILQGPALAVPLIIVSAPLGATIDSMSRRLLLALLMSATLIGTLLSTVATGFESLLLSRAIVGLASFAMGPVAISLISDLFAERLRGRALMSVSISQFTGMAIAFLAGGLILEHVAQNAADWQVPLWALSVPMVAAAISVFWISEPAKSSEAGKSAGSFSGLGRAWRSLVVPFLGLMIVELSVGASLVWAAPSFMRTYGLGADIAGSAVATALMVGGLAGTFAAGFIADWAYQKGGVRGASRTIAGFCVASSIAGLFAIAPNWLAASIGFVIYMALIAIVIVMATTLFTILIAPELRGRGLGLLAGACVLFGTALAPFCVSLFSESAPLGPVLSAVCFLTGICAATTFAFGGRRRSFGSHQ